MEESFDIVIVGSGSAGAVLANRLSADGRHSVCVIEAGPPDRSLAITLPMGLFWLMDSRRFNWRYQTAPQAHLGGRTIPVPRGRTLGGSSSINGMVYIRGHPSDYDGWAAMGCTGWAWDDVLPYFRRSEHNERLGGSPLHGSGGELWVSDNPAPHPLTEVFIAAGEALQIPRNDDFNGPRQEGLGRFQTTTRDGLRWSTADAFLRPALGRPNLAVRTGAMVRRLVFEGRRAAAVETDRGLVRARAAVILSAGAIGSPQILQLSGVGDPARLRPLGIAPVIESPEVGANFHDHPHAPVVLTLGMGHSYGISWLGIPMILRDALRFLYRRRGLFASNIIEAGGFVHTRPGLAAPDVQFHFSVAHRSRQPGRVIAWGHGCSVSACVLRPESRGRVDIVSADPLAPPRIDPNMLAEEADRATLLAGIRLARRILSSEGFRRLGAREIAPGPGVGDDADALTAYLREKTITVYHPVGSCRMGADARAVVDPRLRLRGAEALYVVDASIMPRIVSGNTNAPVIMIAEKAADMIRADLRQRP
ncbi:MAG: choline dehydrogenase [Paracoccaceae bacterium]|nr:MAG: choline dehydrogenase [Paracoccaceae bacterium]